VNTVMAHRVVLAALAAVLLGTIPAAALSVDQVIGLKKAGVSERTIQKMIRVEGATRRMGGVGRYELKVSEGKDLIVYQASSPRGVVDYPWYEGEDLPAAGATRAAAALDAPAAKAKDSAKSYALHLSSFRDQKRAQSQVATLAAGGVEARVEPVDLGEKGRWYRVMAGRFAGKQAAEKQGQRLKAAGGISSFRVIPD